MVSNLFQVKRNYKIGGKVSIDVSGTFTVLGVSTRLINDKEFQEKTSDMNNELTAFHSPKDVPPDQAPEWLQECKARFQAAISTGNF